MERADRARELVTMLWDAGELREEVVTVRGVPAPLRVIRPVDTDVLLDRIADDPEQNLPYWAELWPSGVGLASEIAAEPALVAGKRVVELGSGVGITAAVALAAGADLLATDYAPESLTLTRWTCLHHAGCEPRTMQLNWRNEADVACLLADGPFTVVLAADVLYEQRDIVPLLRLFDRLIVPGGIVLLAHPGRDPARRLLDRARNEGWVNSVQEYMGPWPDPDDFGIVVFVHRLVRPAIDLGNGVSGT
ncbi:MAG: methyltransferase domain-containing protein [Thermomicrobiales bacterium]